MAEEHRDSIPPTSRPSLRALMRPTASTTADHIRAEQVRMLFQQAPPAQLLSIAAAGVVCWALWNVGDRDLLRAWFAVITIVTLGRMALAVAFQRRGPAAEAMPHWELAFLITLAIVSLAWGMGGWAVMPRSSVLHQAVVYFFLMGIAGGAVASYSAHAVASAISVCALMLPATVAFALQGTPELRALALGGLLYLAAAIRSTRTFGFFMRRTFQLSFELQQAYGRAREQARTDDLTRLANRRAFVEQGRAALDQAKRYNRPLSLVLFDIDHFKRVNDSRGHAAGDEVLKKVAALLAAVVRASDTAGRIGGEEFGVLLPETAVAEARLFAERLREGIRAQAIVHDGAEMRVSCSFGVAQAGPQTTTLDGLLGAADAALYRAKEAGRDRVEAA